MRDKIQIARLNTRKATKEPNQRARKVARPPLLPVAPEAIQLIDAKGGKDTGGGPGGQAWKIEAEGRLAGKIFINFIDEPPLGIHASIQIYLNQPSQRRQIGRIAYRLACEASSYDTVYAHMRKSNIASRRAAEAAGFADVTPPGYTQLLMAWHRPVS